MLASYKQSQHFAEHSQFTCFVCKECDAVFFGCKLKATVHSVAALSVHVSAV